MQIVVISDAYPPMKTSGAVQIRDLVSEFVNQGHKVTVLLPDSSISSGWDIEKSEGIEILRLKAPQTKDVSYIRRAIGEYLLSFFMFRNLKKSPLKERRWDALVWYSPSIFFGKLVRKIKSESQCPGYLVLRDIFPEWAVDMGLLKRGLIYRYFKKVEREQYLQADTIGVQTPSVLNYFEKHQHGLPASVEVLNNWLSEPKTAPCCITIDETILAGRKLFVYTGNIGVAQGMDILIDLAAELNDDKSVGFIFVGRGSAVAHVKQRAVSYQLSNILFFDEIDPVEIPSLLSECHIGLIALDPRHKNDNIPGKFLAYMQAGLPVLATINAGNDLEKLIQDSRVGKVVIDNSLQKLIEAAKLLLEEIKSDSLVTERCKALSASTFSTKAAASQIIHSLEKQPVPNSI